MLFDTLLKLFDGTDVSLDTELYDSIKLRIEKNADTSEGEMNDHIPRILKFIEEGLAFQKEMAEKTEDDRQSDFASLNKLFVNEVMR